MALLRERATGPGGRQRGEFQAAAVEGWLGRLETAYGGHIVPVDTEIAGAWARLSVPDPLPVIDGLLAATAAARDWTLVTRNAGDVERTGVRVLNPVAPS
jgi:toxin FitB